MQLVVLLVSCIGTQLYSIVHRPFWLIFFLYTYFCCKDCCFSYIIGPQMVSSMATRDNIVDVASNASLSNTHASSNSRCNSTFYAATQTPIALTNYLWPILISWKSDKLTNLFTPSFHTTNRSIFVPEVCVWTNSINQNQPQYKTVPYSIAKRRSGKTIISWNVKQWSPNLLSRLHRWVRAPS